MSAISRRYDIDWVRVIAIGLLLIYHVAIGFQIWGGMIGFITNSEPWGALWTPMTMLNIWRIPLLFFVSGMGVYFAIQKRNWKQLLKERAGRILVPFIFGVFVIVPIHVYLWQSYYHWDLSYNANPSHLWFLGNISAYVVLLAPVFFYLKKHQEGRIVKGIKKVLSSPLGLVPVILAFVAEALIIDPIPFELYAMTWHGFVLGLLAFFFGFCFVLSGASFWKMLLKWRWLFVFVAILLYVIRFIEFESVALSYLMAIESNLWIFSVFAFSYKYLNRPSKVLNYLSQAAYPVYILHMVFIYLGSLIVFPLEIAVPLKFVLVLLFTVLGAFAVYEFIIRRMKIMRPLFGLKVK